MAILLTLLLVGAARLVVSQSTGIPTRLYKIPSNYKARLDAFSGSSSPSDVTDVQKTTTPSNYVTTTTATTTTTTEEPQRRRHIQVSPSEEERLALQCDGIRECGESTKLAGPGEHPDSKMLLDRFLKDYQALNGGSTSNSPEKDTTSFRTEQLNERDELDADPSNRLANSYLGNDYNSTDDKETRSKGAHWDIYPSSHHHHPDEDREGWVTLEAIPWSQSKISKWFTDNKPHWSNAVQPSKPSHDWGSVERPPPWEERPSDWAFEKPSKPEHWYPPSDGPWPPSRPNSKPTFQYHPSSHLHHDIITDDSPQHHWTPHGGVPGVFKPWPSGGGDYSYTTHRPSYHSYHHDHPPFHHDGHPPGHPENSDGEWVLVSNTKGYSSPHRYKNYKRALTFSPKPLTSTRTVRLTVLPDANTTTSHGGLLEVQESFDTVEEDRAAMERRKQVQRRPQNDPVPSRPTTNRYPTRVPVRRPVVPARRPMMVLRRPAVQQQRRPVIVMTPGARAQPATTPAPNRGRAAMLAAVTAGVLPATMAVVVPAMMMGRRRRRRDAEAGWQLVARQSGRNSKLVRRVVRRRKQQHQQRDEVATSRLVLPPPHIREAFNILTH